MIERARQCRFCGSPMVPTFGDGVMIGGVLQRLKCENPQCDARAEVTADEIAWWRPSHDIEVG